MASETRHEKQIVLYSDTEEFITDVYAITWNKATSELSGACTINGVEHGVFKHPVSACWHVWHEEKETALGKLNAASKDRLNRFTSFVATLQAAGYVIVQTDEKRLYAPGHVQFTYRYSNVDTHFEVMIRTVTDEEGRIIEYKTYSQNQF